MRSRGRKPQSNRGFIVGLVAVAVIGVGALAYVATRPKPAPVTIDPNLQPGAAQGYLIGRADAPVQVLEFADFECPACGNFAVVTEPDIRRRLIETGKMSLRFYDFPLSMHRNTWHASRAAACANDQGKFWEMHDRVFAGQPEWNSERTTDPSDILLGYAKALGLNESTFEECYRSRRHDATIRGNQAEGERLRVSSTPTFIIGGRVYAGALPSDEMVKIVDSVAAAGTGRVGTPAAAATGTAAPAPAPAAATPSAPRR